MCGDQIQTLSEYYQNGCFLQTLFDSIRFGLAFTFLLFLFLFLLDK
jgi:hypothetical protein